MTNPVTGEPTDPRPGGGPEHPFQAAPPPPPPPAAEPGGQDEPDKQDKQDKQDEQDEPGGQAGADEEAQPRGGKRGQAISDR